MTESYADKNPPTRRDFPDRSLARSGRHRLRELTHRGLFADGKEIAEGAVDALRQCLERGPDAHGRDNFERMARLDRGEKIGPYFVPLMRPRLDPVSYLSEGEIADLSYEEVPLYVCKPEDEEPTGESEGANVVRLAQAAFGKTRRFAVVDAAGRYALWFASRPAGHVRDDVACYLDAVGKWSEIQKHTADEEEDAARARLVGCGHCGHTQQHGCVDMDLSEMVAAGCSDHELLRRLERYNCDNCGELLPHWKRARLRERTKAEPEPPKTG